MSVAASALLGHELLDDPGADPALVATSLGNIARANYWLGGRAAVRFGLGRLLPGARPGTTLTLLDIGTGLGDLPAAARAWARARGFELSLLGCDQSPVACRLARQRRVHCAVAAAGALPFANRSVDLVLISQVAHHLERNAAVDLLRAANRIARIGVIVSDLLRSRVAALGFGLAGRVLGFDQVTLHDGALSVRRGYARHEFGALLRAAGIDTIVHAPVPWRLVAAWRAQEA